MRPVAEVSRFVFPVDVTLRNQIFVERVCLTMHAWERFCERYIDQHFRNNDAFLHRPIPTAQSFYLNVLRACFGQAQRRELPVWIILERRRNNNTRPVLYLENPAIKLGFVVSNDFRRPATLITVDPIP